MSPEHPPWRRDPLIAAAAVAVFVGVLLTLPVPQPAAPPGGALPETGFAIVDATVFDGEDFLPHRDVRVEEGRIRAVGQRLDLPEGLPRVDGRRHTLLPGLIDGHTHSFGSALEDSLRFGVTTVLDQFTAPPFAAAKRPARDRLARGEEADLFSAGNLATPPGGHGTRFGVPSRRSKPLRKLRPSSGRGRRRAPTGSRSSGRIIASVPPCPPSAPVHPRLNR